MRASAAQIHPFKGDIEQNIELHIYWIGQAVAHDSDLIIFPELSLTGYEPELAKELAIEPTDPRLESFRELSDRHGISIALGAPSAINGDVFISNFWFQPGQPTACYSKMFLHKDEERYFKAGEKALSTQVKSTKVVPAICYESLLDQHNRKAWELGAGLYAASVAKPKSGVGKAFEHFPRMARKYSIPILMSNAMGPSDNFISAGSTAFWDSRGKLLSKLSKESQGVLSCDLNTMEVLVHEE